MSLTDFQLLVAQARREAGDPAFKVSALYIDSLAACSVIDNILPQTQAYFPL